LAYEEKMLGIVRPLEYLFKGLKLGEFEVAGPIQMAPIYEKKDAFGVRIRVDFKRTGLTDHSTLANRTLEALNKRMEAQSNSSSSNSATIEKK
jgi:hypothetical protein